MEVGHVLRTSEYIGIYERMGHMARWDAGKGEILFDGRYFTEVERAKLLSSLRDYCLDNGCEMDVDHALEALLVWANLNPLESTPGEFFPQSRG